jgi:hypothetical protein
MSFDYFGVSMLRDNPEAFIIFRATHEPRTGFLRSANDFTENELRAELGAMGCPQQDTDLRIAEARNAFGLKHNRFRS